MDDEQSQARTELFEIIQKNDVPGLARILQADKDLVNARSSDEFADTPATAACYFGNSHILQYLLTTGASPTTRNEKDQTPAFVAALQGHANCLRVLGKHLNPISQINSPCIYTQKMMTPIQIAQQKQKNDYLECIKFIQENVQHIPDVGKDNSDYNSPCSWVDDIDQFRSKAYTCPLNPNESGQFYGSTPNAKREGFGVLVIDDNYTYEGLFVDGKRCGHGVLRLSPKSEGELDGSKYRFISAKDVIDGFWVEDKLHGDCVIIKEDCTRWKARFNAGEPEYLSPKPISESDAASVLHSYYKTSEVWKGQTAKHLGHWAQHLLAQTKEHQHRRESEDNLLDQALKLYTQSAEGGHTAARKSAERIQKWIDNPDMKRILVVGGGPAGLVTAIKIAENCAKHNKFDELDITVRDTRYDYRGDGTVIYAGSRTAREHNHDPRRGQVVTLQNDAVESSMSRETQELIFKTHHESVWSSTSKNIPICEVEDRLVERAQSPELLKVMRLEVGEPDDFRNPAHLFDCIIGADGARSWVRSNIMSMPDSDPTQVLEEGQDLALGVAFQIPPEEFPDGLPFPQSQNVVTTLAQRRFLLNASSIENKGFLNIQITQEEYNQAKRVDGSECVFGRSPAYVRTGDLVQDQEYDKDDASLFKPQKDAKDDPTSDSAALWRTVQDGLRLFGIPTRHVQYIVSIKLTVRYARSVVQDLHANGPSGSRSLGVLVGDAAFQTHFWPGRGMNSVIKEGALLGHCIFRACCRLQPGRPLHSGMQEFSQYEGFINTLRVREHRARSNKFLCHRTGKQDRLPDLRQEAKIMATSSLQGGSEDLISALYELLYGEKRILSRLRSLSSNKENWPHKPLRTELLLNSMLKILEKISPLELFLMKSAGPWPAAPGEEILPTPVMRIIDEYAKSKEL